MHTHELNITVENVGVITAEVWTVDDEGTPVIAVDSWELSRTTQPWPGTAEYDNPDWSTLVETATADATTRGWTIDTGNWTPTQLDSGCYVNGDGFNVLVTSTTVPAGIADVAGAR